MLGKNNSESQNRYILDKDDDLNHYFNNIATKEVSKIPYIPFNCSIDRQVNSIFFKPVIDSEIFNIIH